MGYHGSLLVSCGQKHIGSLFSGFPSRSITISTLFPWNKSNFARKRALSTGSRGSKVLINVLSLLALMHIHVLSEQPNPRAFLTQSILASTVSRDVTERGPPSLSQASRGQRGKRERPGIRLFSEYSNRTA